MNEFIECLSITNSFIYPLIFKEPTLTLQLPEGYWNYGFHGRFETEGQSCGGPGSGGIEGNDPEDEDRRLETIGG